MASIKIIPTINFKQQLRDGAIKSTSTQMAKRLSVKAPTILSKVADFLIKTFNESDVARSLRGQGTDLPAHFGLTDETAAALADGMAELIANSIKLLVSPNNPKAIIRILAISSVWEEYTKLVGGEYISAPSGITIPVARWLLIDPNIDIGQAAFDIVFDGSKVDLSKSRSGRALMIELGLDGTNSPYILPAIVQKKAGKNFIEYALGNAEVAKTVMNIIMNNL